MSTLERAVSSAQLESGQVSGAVDGSALSDSLVRFRSPVGPLLANRSALLRYLVAILVVCAVVVGRVAAEPLLGTQAPLLPFAVAIFAVAYLCGFGPAILAILVSTVITSALFTTHQFAASALAWAGHVTIFVILAALVSVMMHRLQLAYRAQYESLRSANASAIRLQLIADSLPALVAYVDAERRYQFNNRAYQQWFGVQPAQLTGRTLSDVLGEAAYEAVKPHADRALAGERTRFEAELAYRDGGARYVSAHYVPDRDADGVVHGFFSLEQDVTESRKARQALEDAQQRLALALRAGKSGTFDWDITSTHSGWSAELLELHGFKSGDLAGSQEEWEGCSIHPADREHVLASFEGATTNDEVVIDYRIRRQDSNDVRWLHCRGNVVRDAGGRPLRMVGINIDVTEQKRAEEAVRDADRRKDEFLAMLAHELRNPLAPIRYVAHLMAHENADLKTIRRNGDILLRQVNHLVRLLDDLLDVARISRGKIEIRKEPLNAEAALQRAMEAMQPTLGAKRQSIRYSPPPHPLPILGDAVRLEQVFSNLLSNASKYSPEHSPIHVSATFAQGEAVIRIRDEGTGIEAHMLPRVFDLFLQADQSLDRPQGGLGIGLTIVKRVVELHGGRVEARSEGLGRGSEFVMRLPLADSELPSVARERGYQVVSRRVLVVEDNEDSAQMLSALLKSDGHEVSTAHDGSEALDQLESFAPECVLMDIGLPGMDGYAVVGIMRQRNTGKSARIYALTGYGHPEDRDMALRSGFDGHLTKPVDPDSLLRLLSEAPQHVTSRSRVTRH